MNREADVQTVLNTLGHDLRSPLFTAHGFLQLVVSRTEGKAHDLARHALASVEEAARMVDGILQWARTHESRTEVADVDLAEVVADIQRDLAGLARRFHVRLETEPLPTVRGDKRSLHYALQHLIDNAIRHGGRPDAGTGRGGTTGRVGDRAQPGSGAAEAPPPADGSSAAGGSEAPSGAQAPQRVVEVRGGDKEDGWWVEVEDDGPGISGSLSDLRMPFWETPNRGSGAGIALAEKVAIQHGGRLEIESGAEGTRARITGTRPEGTATPAAQEDVPTRGTA